MAVNITKVNVREEILKKRSALNPVILKNNSKTIFGRLIKLEKFINSRTVMCYMDFKNEVKTQEFIGFCLETGKKVAVPLITDAFSGKREMKAYSIDDIEKDLGKGHFGILEPNVEKTAEVYPGEIDLIVVPGVAFGENLHRIGYGAGYYDRFLMTVRPECFKVGAALELQVVDELPAEEHDVKLDMIITEKRIICHEGIGL